MFELRLLYLHSENTKTVLVVNAKVAHLVEHDLAKVGVASSSLVFRSKQKIPSRDGIFFGSLGGGTGRHAGLKILSSATEVRVRFPPEAQSPLL